MTLQSKISLAVGCVIYTVLLYGIVFDSKDLALQFACFYPGPLFAGLILLFTPNMTINKGVASFIFCCGIYYVSIYFIINYAVDKNYYILVPIFSCLNAVLIAIFHSFLFKSKIELKRDILKPGMIGFLSSLLTFLCFSGIFRDDIPDLVFDVVFYSIFPIWTIFMSKHLLAEKLKTSA